jgi:hypothetical protein
MGVKSRFLLLLGDRSKQAGDEQDLSSNVPFFQTCAGYFIHPFVHPVFKESSHGVLPFTVRQE